jgi:hypothetical protein
VKLKVVMRGCLCVWNIIKAADWCWTTSQTEKTCSMHVYFRVELDYDVAHNTSNNH